MSQQSPPPTVTERAAGPGVRFGLRFKFLLLVSVLFVVLVAGLAFYLIRSGEQTLRNNLQREAKSFATLAATPIGSTFVLYQNSGTNVIDNQIDSYTQLDSVISNVSLAGLDGKILYTRNKAMQPNISIGQASSFTPTFLYRGTNGALSRIIYPYFEGSGSHRYTLVYDISSQQIETQVKNQTKSITLIALTSLVIMTTATFALINYFILRPIRRVSVQAAIISSGNLEQEIEVAGHDEISQLGGAVNTMANSLKANISKLQELDKVKTEFMMIASHNLRTPLTIISGYVDSAEKLTEVQQFRKAFDNIAISAKRLNVFAEDVLTISRFELGGDELDREKVDMRLFISEIAADFSDVCRQQGRTFNSTLGDGPIMANISRPHLRSAIWNLLDNALKFTKEKGDISLALSSDNQQLKIVIADTGVGIAEDEIPKLFTKFHRGTSTLTYDYEGTGLGLYASKIIVMHHGGDIDVVSQLGKGSTFTVKLPLEPAK